MSAGQTPTLCKQAILSALRNRTPVQLRVPLLRPAGVLVPLFAHPKDGTTHLWLMQRTEDGGAHAGQVALPGGKPTEGDLDLEHTALREAWEELGIAPEQVEVLGVLDDCPTITGFRIRPLVGWISTALTPRPNPAEVARHFSAPLSMFLEQGSRNWVHWANVRRLVRSYDVEGAVVWGATAAILSKFGQVLLQHGS